MSFSDVLETSSRKAERSAHDELEVALGRLDAKFQELSSRSTVNPAAIHAARTLGRHCFSLLERYSGSSERLILLRSRFDLLRKQFLERYQLNIATDSASQPISADGPLRSRSKSPGRALRESVQEELRQVDIADVERTEDLQAAHAELKGLQELVSDVSGLISTQKTGVEQISKDVAVASEQVEQGETHLNAALHFLAARRYFILPVAGALVGGLVAGPVGFVAGLKGGLLGLTAAGGVAAGGLAGGGIAMAAAPKTDSDKRKAS